MKKQTKKLVLSKETVKPLDLVVGATTEGCATIATGCSGNSCSICLDEPLGP